MRMTSRTSTVWMESLPRLRRASRVQKVRVTDVPAAVAIVIVIAGGAVAAVVPAVRVVTAAATLAVVADAEEGRIASGKARLHSRKSGPQRCGPFSMVCRAWPAA